MFNSKIDGLFVLETRPRLSTSRLGGVGSTRRHQHCELWNEFFCLDVSAAVTGVKDAPVFGSTRRLWVRGQTSPNPQSPTLGHELSGTVASYYTLHIMVANIFLLRKKRESTLKMMEKSQDLYVILFWMYIHLLQVEICLATPRLHQCAWQAKLPKQACQCKNCSIHLELLQFYNKCVLSPNTQHFSHKS